LFVFLQQIEKAANALKNSVDQFRIFINSMDHWVIKNRERALKIFQTFDVSDTGKITHDQFKAGTVISLLPLHQRCCEQVLFLAVSVHLSAQNLKNYHRKLM